MIDIGVNEDMRRRIERHYASKYGTAEWNAKYPNDPVQYKPEQLYSFRRAEST